MYGAWDRIDERAGLGVFIERLDPNDAAIVDNRGESPKVGTVLVALHVTQLSLNGFWPQYDCLAPRVDRFLVEWFIAVRVSCRA